MDPTGYILSLISDLTFDEKIRMVEQIVDEIYQEYLPLGSHLLPTEFRRFLVLWNRTIDREMGSWDRAAKREFKKRPEAAAYLEEYSQFCEKYATEVAAVVAYQREMSEGPDAMPVATSPVATLRSISEESESEEEPPPPPPPSHPPPPPPPPTSQSPSMQCMSVAFAPYTEGSQIIHASSWKHYPHCRFLAGTHVFSAHFPHKEAAFNYALGRYTIITHSNREGDPYYFGFYRPGKSLAPHHRNYSTWYRS